jgi:hypothetical protein
LIDEKSEIEAERVESEEEAEESLSVQRTNANKRLTQATDRLFNVKANEMTGAVTGGCSLSRQLSRNEDGQCFLGIRTTHLLLAKAHVRNEKERETGRSIDSAPDAVGSPDTLKKCS